MASTKQPTIKQLASPQEHYKRTVARIAKIQSHLATTPRTGKLKGKVAIVTGVGSLKGVPLHYYLPMKALNISTSWICLERTFLI